LEDRSLLFAFFGYPGAGKTTLVRRFAEMHGMPGIDTDRFMTPADRAAVVEGRYTQEMRLANIARYCAYLRSALPPTEHAALADGLPNNAARRFLREQFPPETVQFVLVQTEPGLWRRRLAERSGNLVPVGVADALAYIHANWEPVATDLNCSVVDNVEDGTNVALRLEEIFRQACGGT
jgi:gluconate kinase